MSDQNKIVTAESAAYTEEQRRLITDVLCKGATDLEVRFFFQVAERCNLDPFKRQIHAVKRWDGTMQRNVMTFQVGIDGLRAIAARTGLYAGNDDPVFELDNNGFPVKATVTVYRLVGGQRQSFTASVYYSECVQTVSKEKGGGPNSMWAKRPFGQLGKCAEAAALRKAFPEESSGLLIEDEVHGDDLPQQVHVQSVAVQQQPQAGRTQVVEAELQEERQTYPEGSWQHLYTSKLWKRCKMPKGTSWSLMPLLHVFTNPDIRDAVLAEDWSEDPTTQAALDAANFVRVAGLMSERHITQDMILAELASIEPHEFTNLMDIPGAKIGTVLAICQNAKL